MLVTLVIINMADWWHAPMSSIIKVLTKASPVQILEKVIGK